MIVLASNSKNEIWKYWSWSGNLKTVVLIRSGLFNMCWILPDSSPEIRILYTSDPCSPLLPLVVPTSVEHDPVSGSQSNRIVHYRTGSGLDWILKKNSTGSDMDIQTALITAVKCLIRGFFGYKLDQIFRQVYRIIEKNF